MGRPKLPETKHHTTLRLDPEQAEGIERFRKRVSEETGVDLPLAAASRALVTKGLRAIEGPSAEDISATIALMRGQIEQMFAQLLASNPRLRLPPVDEQLRGLAENIVENLERALASGERLSKEATLALEVSREILRRYPAPKSKGGKK